jgi:hypothetical protein
MLIHLFIVVAILFICVWFYKRIVEKKEKIITPTIENDDLDSNDEPTDVVEWRFNALNELRGKAYYNHPFSDTKTFTLLDNDNFPIGIRIPSELYDAVCAQFMITSFEKLNTIEWFKKLIREYDILLPSINMDEFNENNMIQKEFNKTGFEYIVTEKTDEQITKEKEQVSLISSMTSPLEVIQDEDLFKKVVYNVNGLAGAGKEHYEVFVYENGFRKKVIKEKKKFDSYINTFGDDKIPSEKEYSDWSFDFELNKKIDDIMSKAELVVDTDNHGGMRGESYINYLGKFIRNTPEEIENFALLQLGK